MPDQKSQKNTTERSPIIAVMGHIDHGKSALLDYIRKSNVVENEAGGITQHISAYEVNQGGKKITFLDTPGHAAFTAMRSRGANIADIAILIVSAEEGPKPQTLEALESIKEAKIPFIVAINKIDKPGADIERTKNQLVEKEIYLEGFGGDIPFAPISAKSGEGIPELLDTLLLMAEMEELKGDGNKNAEGFVLESNRDPKKGISATLIINNGTMKSGSFIVVEDKIAPTRIMQDFLGKPIKEVSFSSPVEIIGFKDIPTVGSTFVVVDSKKEAEKLATAYTPEKTKGRVPGTPLSDEGTIIPLIIKADVLGSIEAIEKEISKIETKNAQINIIHTGVGDINENDILMTGNAPMSLVVGFNVKLDVSAQDLAERAEIDIKTFDIIYKLTEWLEKKVIEKTPKKKVEKIIGKAKVMRIFNKTKNKQVVGGEVIEGSLSVGAKLRILRRENEIDDRGKVAGIQVQKNDVNEASEGQQFGSMIESKQEIAKGDVLEAFIISEE